MGKLNLKSQNANEKIILEYLENNASNELVEKINNGTKTLEQCWKYICKEAEAYLNRTNGAIADAVVFGWAIHFFEEDSIEVQVTSKPQVKVKHNDTSDVEDTEETDDEIDVEIEKKPKKAAKVKKEKKKPEKPVEETPQNKGYEQTSLFDLLGD